MLVCRSEASAKQAIQLIADERPAAGERCKFIPMDLCSLQSVKTGCKLIQEQVTHINILILNAGVFALPHTLTENKLETIFQVSHLSHFYMANLLESCLDHRSRVIIVSSESHR